MSPYKHYEVLAAVEINGTLHDVGAIVELVEADAMPFVQAGQLKEQVNTAPAAPEGATPAAPADSQPVPPATPSEPAVPAQPAPSEPAAPAQPEAPKQEAPASGWVGGHTVGGNEQPRKGGSVTERHPGL